MCANLNVVIWTINGCRLGFSFWNRSASTTNALTGKSMHRLSSSAALSFAVVNWRKAKLGPHVFSVSCCWFSRVVLR